MPTKKNVNAIEPDHNVEAVPTEAVVAAEAIPATTDTPVKKPKKTPNDTKILKKEITDLTTKLNEMSAKVSLVKSISDWAFIMSAITIFPTIGHDA